MDRDRRTPPMPRVVDGPSTGRLHPLDRKITRIGRWPDLVPGLATASRRHAVIERPPGGSYLCDLASLAATMQPPEQKPRALMDIGRDPGRAIQADDMTPLCIGRTGQRPRPGNPHIEPRSPDHLLFRSPPVIKNQKERLDVEFIDQITIIRLLDKEIHHVFCEGDDVAQISKQIDAIVHSARPRNLLLDFSEVRFLASFMQVYLLDLQRRLRRAGCRLKVCGLNEHVEECFRITDLYRMFAIHPDERSALDGFDSDH